MLELIEIQSELKCPKKNQNTFSNFAFRTCADILSSLKTPLLNHGCFLLLTEEIVQRGDRWYVEATATVTNKKGQSVSSRSFARECEKKTKFDEAQITGAATSYARKYALGGLFAIDDSPDMDSLPPEVTPPPFTFITDVQYAELMRIVQQAPLSYEEICQKGTVTSLKELEATRFEPLKKFLMKLILDKKSD